MSDLVVLEGFSLLPQGATLSMSLSAGQSLCLVGPAASGKSRFIRGLQGKERAAQGRIELQGRWVEASREGFWRRATPTTLARKWAGRKAGDASQAISALGLWSRRGRSLDSLSATETIACELLAPLASSDPILFVDGHLDALDAWVLESAWAGLKHRCESGVLIVATNRLDLCHRFDLIVVLKECRVAFAGTVEELLREADPTELVVESRSQTGVRALVEPFQVSISAEPDGLHLQATEGQAIAAKLLMEGYGDVRAIVAKPPSIEDAVRRVWSR